MADSGPHMEAKIFVDKAKNRVLFLEADGDLVDVLFSFLTLPLGTIIRLIGKTHSTLGSFTTLHQSVIDLSPNNFWAEQYRDMLLRPRSSSEDLYRRLRINIDDTEAKYFLCSSSCFVGCSCPNFTSVYRNTKCPDCGKAIDIEKSLEGSKYCSEVGVFVRRGFRFIITDDLRVMPVVRGTVAGLFKSLGVDDMSVVEELTVFLGLDEVMELLKWTLLSPTPLTNLFLAKENLPKNPVKKEQKQSSQRRKRLCFDDEPQRFGKINVKVDDESQQFGKINVKVVLKKTSNEVLFVEAGQDFVDFLFSFLVAPLGEVLHIMKDQSRLGCIDGLHKSALFLDPQYFLSPYHQNIVLRPRLAPTLKRVNRLLPLVSKPLRCSISGAVRTMPVDCALMGGDASSGGFLRGKGTFIVSDDLTVTPLNVATAMSFYKRHNVSVSDLEERTMSIGMTEGISILRASLNSTSAISNGLLHSNLNFKKPKQEKPEQEK